MDYAAILGQGYVVSERVLPLCLQYDDVLQPYLDAPSRGNFVIFQAEDGIRGRNVTGVQTCALPIFAVRAADGRSPNGGSSARRVRASARPQHGPRAWCWGAAAVPSGAPWPCAAVGPAARGRPERARVARLLIRCQDVSRGPWQRFAGAAHHAALAAFSRRGRGLASRRAASE